MKRDWKRFVSSLPYKVIFLHKNELPSSLRKEPLDLPCLLLQEESSYKVLIAAKEFRTITNLAVLKQTVHKALG